MSIQNLKKWATWFRASKLKVNTQKTTTTKILFHPKDKKINIQKSWHTAIYDDNEPNTPIDYNKIFILDRVHNSHPDPSNRCYKLLLVLLDKNQTFAHHIKLLHSKLSRSVSCINRVKNTLPRKAFITLHHLTHNLLFFHLQLY